MIPDRWHDVFAIFIDRADARSGKSRTTVDSARLAVSPDGLTILVHRTTATADLMAIENFR